jgi:hypothetical protein
VSPEARPPKDIGIENLRDFILAPDEIAIVTTARRYLRSSRSYSAMRGNFKMDLVR